MRSLEWRVADMIAITCKNCKDTFPMGHLEWSTVICPTCNNEIKNYLRRDPVSTAGERNLYRSVKDSHWSRRDATWWKARLLEAAVLGFGMATLLILFDIMHGFTVTFPTIPNIPN